LLLFRTIAHNPRVLTKVRAANLLDRGSIERTDRELAILRTCARCGSEYEWGVHVAAFARRYGLSEEKIAATLHWDWNDDRWSAHERTIVRLVDELHDTASVSDAAWEELSASFDSAQIVELVVLVGFYHSISFVTNALQVDREAGAARFPARPR
jgi:alkylhydroperoxidase family enzyme